MRIGDELLNILTKFYSLIDIEIDGNCKYSNDTLEQFFESCRERMVRLDEIWHFYY